jgi:Domain of unknown function (DUF4157)/Putative amidase domain
VASSLGRGRPLEPGVRGRMEEFFGHDFSRVRVHTDARADGLTRSLHALAFTVGDQVAFAAGRYRPDTPSAARLLAHELTHVVQQRRGLDGDLLRAGMGTPGDRYERDAERNAERYAHGLGSAAAGGAATRPSSRSGRDDAVVQRYSGSKAAAYARKFAKGWNLMKYTRYSNDCTNFVSQAVREGGWEMVGGSCDDRKNDDVWWYGGGFCWWMPTVYSSYTWAGAHNFGKFAGGSGRGTPAKQVHELKIGDILQIAFPGKSNIGHSMVMTGTRDKDYLFSYHSTDTLDAPFWAPGGILSRNPGATFYGWKL